MSKKYNIGIVGATGAVGQEFIQLLERRNYPVGELRLLASARSAGRTIEVGSFSGKVVEATPEAFRGLDFAIFSAGGSVSEALAPVVAKEGVVVIDNSSAFRQDPEVPLVVPEINPEAAKKHRGIVANPNCSTAIALMGLYPLHQLFGLRSVVASTYQAVSGSGTGGVLELEAQLRAWAKGETAAQAVYPHPIAFNVLPHVDRFEENGYTKEEMKMVREGRKIMDLPDLAVSCTCVRVPVLRAHSMSLSASFEKPVDLAAAREAIRAFPGVELQDDPSGNLYPLPLERSGKEACAVGRLRKDLVMPNGLSLWVVGDQLWKGAALNALQIAELLFPPAT